MYMNVATLHAVDQAARPSRYDVALKPGIHAQAYANALSAALGSRSRSASTAVTVISSRSSPWSLC